MVQQGEYAEAKDLYKKAQKILENSVGQDSLEVAMTLNNRAMWCRNQVGAVGSLPQSSSVLFNVDVTRCGGLHRQQQPNGPTLPQGNYDEADSLYVQVLKFQEKHLGPDHPALALTLNNQANSWRDQVSAIR